MNTFALAFAGLAFPSVIILGVVIAALRHRLPSGVHWVVASWIGLGLVAVVLTSVWFILAHELLLGWFTGNFFYAFVTASIPEEGFRFLIIWLGLRRRPPVSLQTAMLKGCLVGLTFGTFEHVLYAVDKGWETWLARSFTSVPYHTLSGAVLAYFCAVVIRTRQPWGLAGLIFMVTLHGLGNWSWILNAEDDGTDIRSDFLKSGWAGNIASLVVTAVLAIVLVLKARRADAIVPEAGLDPHHASASS